MAKTITGQVLVTSASNAAGAGNYTRGRLDASAADGGQIRFKMTNGGTLGTQCEARVMVARKQASMPAAGVEGSGDDAWKQVYVIGSGLVSGAVTRGVYTFGPEVAYVQIEFNGNTTAGVTVECVGDTYVY
jgi:hypothetical protein